MEKIALSTGVTLAWEECGNPQGTPLILVHGHSGRSAGYRFLIEELRANFRILIFDHRGHGSSDKPLGDAYESTLPLYTMQQLRDDLKALVDALHFPAPFVLFGHSMGGMVAQEFAVTYPKLVSHLVLASTAAAYGTAGTEALVEQFKSGQMEYNEKAWVLLAGLGLTMRYRRTHPELIEEELENKRQVPKWVYIALMENFVRNYDVRERLPGIQIPTLVITGRRDAVIQWTFSQEIAQLIPKARLVVIPKQNHGIDVEVPELVAGEVARLLQPGC